MTHTHRLHLHPWSRTEGDEALTERDATAVQSGTGPWTDRNLIRTPRTALRSVPDLGDIGQSRGSHASPELSHMREEALEALGAALAGCEPGRIRNITEVNRALLAALIVLLEERS